jgi:hypothetical protein
MLKTISTLIAASAISAPAIAETFVHDGTTYVYSVQQRGAKQLIIGEDATRHVPFTLSVSRGRVDGTVNGRAVSFPIRDVARLNPKPANTKVATR